MSSRSDTVSVYLICMARRERGREKPEKGRKKMGEERVERSGINRRKYKIKVEKCLQKDLKMWRTG